MPESLLFLLLGPPLLAAAFLLLKRTVERQRLARR